MAKLFLEVIAAPGFDEAAKAKFAAKKNLRLVEVSHAPQKWVLKNVSGGMLVQDADTRPLAGVRSQGGHQAPAYAGRKARPAVRLEGLQAREVECDSLRARRADGRRRRRPDEPRGFLQDRRHEGGPAAARERWPRPTRSSPFPTEWRKSPRSGRRRSFSPADRCATRRSLRPPTGWAWP